MASIEDLIATLSGGLHAGQQGNDLRDLHAKLASTINNPVPHPHYRPDPPTSTGVSGPLPPPAPASSWNTPPPNTGFLFSTSPLFKGGGTGGGGGGGGGASGGYENGGGAGAGGGNWSVPMPNGGSSLSGRPIQALNGQASHQAESDRLYGGAGVGENGRGGEGQGQGPAEAQDRPYHAAVLPIRASPKDTGGFAEDAFKPLWEGEERQQWNGFQQKER
ncbi:hypothetical protein IAT38_005112 [Cryptococcus sp. DSM 104549]